jgi:predicted dehydrogenase
MSNNLKDSSNNVLLVGTGLMGVEYAKVLDSLCQPYIAIGRGEANAEKFAQTTGHKPIVGGLNAFLQTKPNQTKPNTETAIVAVGMEALNSTATALLEYGVKRILLEKPGVARPDEIKELEEKASKFGATVVLAYNRRFYASVLKAWEIIKQDGGVRSFCFEFTEWSHVIEKLSKPPVVFENWFLGNSTHVVDTAFFLGGKPKTLYALHKGGTNWHPAASVFAGAGESESGALFSYLADWEAPGRWVIEILTKKSRLLFKPMETLQIQEIGSVAVNPVEIDNKLDKDFKPGLYLQTKAFLEGNFSRFCTLSEQREMIEKYYIKIGGYSNNG